MKRGASASRLDALHDGGGGGVRRQWEGNNFRRNMRALRGKRVGGGDRRLVTELVGCGNP